jgi:hypothetical protein
MYTFVDSISHPSHRVGSLGGPANLESSKQTSLKRLITLGAVVLSCLGSAGVLRAQSCPEGDPPEFAYGDLVVLEGLVIVDGPDPINRGEDAAVALDDPVEGGARFLVALVTDVQRSGNNYYTEILATEFSADGVCIAGPKALSDYDDCPEEGCDTEHYLPSVSMSWDARVRVGWIGGSLAHLSAPRGGPWLPGSLLLADFGFDDDPGTWPELLPPSQELHDHEPSVGSSDASANFEAVTWTREWSTAIGSPYGLLYGRVPFGGRAAIRACPDEYDPICERRVGQAPFETIRNGGACAVAL